MNLFIVKMAELCLVKVKLSYSKWYYETFDLKKVLFLLKFIVTAKLHE